MQVKEVKIMKKYIYIPINISSNYIKQQNDG